MDDSLKLHSLVELRDQYSGVYPLSPSGARGWVRGRREMPQLDPEVFIEWDRAHWRYHGENDGWTFEHHFRTVEDSFAPKEPDMNEILTEAHRRVDEERCSNCGEIHGNSEEFLSTLMEAQESALGSDGYVILTLTPQKEGDVTIYSPQLFSGHLTEVAREMLDAQIIHLALQVFQVDMFERLKEIEEPGNE